MPLDTPNDGKHTDAKAPAKTPAPAKPSKLEDEDAPAAAAPALKQKILPTGLSRAIVLSSFVLAIAYAAVGLLHERYAIAAVPNAANSAVYRIDRLTGSLEFCGSLTCSVVRPAAAE